MEQLDQLKQELKIITDNIRRVELFIEEKKKCKYLPKSSHVFGELKHRLFSLKSTLTKVIKMSTDDLF